MLPVAVMLALLGAGCGVLGTGAGDSTPFILYQVSLVDADLSVLRVTGRVFGVTGKKVRLLPPPAGGGREIEPIGITALDAEGNRLRVAKKSKGWEISNRRRDFSFSYRVTLIVEDQYSPEIRGRLSCLGPHHCRLMGRDLFLVPAHRFCGGVVVDYSIFEQRDVHSSRDSSGNRVVFPGLSDLPLSLVVEGDYRYLKATVGGGDLTLAVHGDWNFRDEELMEVIRRVVSREIALFGSSPGENFLFVCDYNPVKGSSGFNYYGIHFAGSILLLFDPLMDRSELFDTPMTIVAHEFFHNWNGEALKPASDDFLWFTEGATVYYSYLVLRDVNLITPQQHRRVERAIAERYRNNPYRSRLAVGRAANHDLGDKDLVNMLYDGGFLVCRALDDRLRTLTGGETGLIDVLKKLYREREHGSAIDEKILLEGIRELTGHDLSAYLIRLIGNPSPPELISSPVSA